MSKPTVAIIGGGWSGLYTAKYCKEEGLEPVVFEKASHIGGQWLYDEAVPGGVKLETKTVSSRLYMSPSDFPYDESLPEFLTSQQVHEHLIKYAMKFKLNPHVKLNSNVLSVDKTSDGKWLVITECASQTFDKLVIATGANLKPRYPVDPMYQRFDGNTYHSHDLKVVGDKFKGRRVLIVGGSDTASDLACELSSTAANVTVSARSGIWFQDRYADEVDPEYAGYPADMNYNRLMDFLLKMTNHKIINYVGFIEWIEASWGIRGSSIEEWYTPAEYLETYYTKSRDLVRQVRQGKVQPARGIEHINGNKVKFAQDPEWYLYDDIIYCTGYKPEPSINGPIDIHAPRYRKILSIGDDSLGFVGYVRPYVTSITMLVEMQARWLAKTFAGKNQLPSIERQKQLTESEESYRKSRFPMYADRMPNLVDPYHYCDTLAKDLGQYPNYLKLLFTKPKIALYTFFDSWNIFCYDLSHPDKAKREQAEAYILEVAKHPISMHVRKALWSTFLWALNKINPFKKKESTCQTTSPEAQLIDEPTQAQARVESELILHGYQRAVQQGAMKDQPGLSSSYDEQLYEGKLAISIG